MSHLSAAMHHIRELPVLTAQDVLDLVQQIAGKQCSFDTQCLDDCIAILEECVAEETLTLEDFAQHPRRVMELDADTPRQSGHVLPFLFNSI